jgi:hypothetical protein
MYAQQQIPSILILPDGTIVKSTHICDLETPGLPHAILGRIVSKLTVASLMGIRILCKLGCTVLFTDTACYVRYHGQVILTGYKDPSTDLWVLPITPNAISQEKMRTSQGHDLVSAQSQAGPCMVHSSQQLRPHKTMMWTSPCSHTPLEHVRTLLNSPINQCATQKSQV